ncbi:MAG: TolC family protein [Salinivirgaceae bacterium]|jgi:outer membrane protein TolC|nr:TolC family protein [Salinivirgaceae bacterium]
MNTSKIKHKNGHQSIDRCISLANKQLNYNMPIVLNIIIKYIMKRIFQIARLFIVAMVLFLSLNGFAQNTISLQMCHDSATANFPLANQKAKLQEIDQLKLDNLSSKYFPSINLVGKASYQSEVVSISIPIPGVSIPEMPKDQYSANIEINQLIYDGGNIKAAKNLNQQSTLVEVQKVEVDIYKIKEQINKLYFQCLLLQENQGILTLIHETIIEQRKVLSSAVKQGMVLESELDNLNAELLRLEQQSIELESASEQVIKAIGILACIDIDKDAELAVPSFNKDTEAQLFRPEHQLFLNQAQLLDASIELTQRKRMPTLGAFANLGYGKPGYDFFNADLHGFYMVGAQFKWNIYDWGHTKKEKQQLTIQKLIIEDNKDAFNKNLNISINESKNRQQKLKQLIVKDRDIIALQEKISKRSADQLKNGTKTSADYLRDLNAEKQARINLESREIQLLQSQIDELSLLGSNIF